MLPFSIDDILGALQKVFETFKQIMEWLGVLVLPSEEQYENYDGYPSSPNKPTEETNG